MKEIGGYLDYEINYGQEYYTNLLRFNTVRNGMLYLIQNKNYNKIYIPYYLCDCVSKMLRKNNIQYEYYSIDENLFPILKNDIEADEVILIVNYFGQFDNEDIIFFNNMYKNIIVDNTQAFFQKPVESVDTIYTCRKYFGVPDGAYLNTDILDAYKLIEKDTSYQRMEHLLGRFETTANAFYMKFKENDDLLADVPVRKMSRLTQNMLCGIDYEKIKKIREENFRFLDDSLNKINQLKIKNMAGLYMYPLLINNGVELKEKLIQNKIFVPTLWPNVLELSDTSWEYYLTNNMVLLPIDQRYGIGDMEYILQILKTYIDLRDNFDY